MYFENKQEVKMKAYVNIKNSENLDTLIKNLKDKKYEIFSSIEELKKANLTANDLDLVAINFDFFENYLDKNIDIETLLENIDVENSALLKEASKNYEKTIIITSHEDFNLDLDNVNLQKRQELALKAFLKTSKYDFLVNQKLTKEFKAKNQDKAYAKIKNHKILWF